MSEPKAFNPKRRLANPAPEQDFLNELAGRVRYVGSPYHKRNPGDFDLMPPSQPKPDKTLCDAAGILTRAQAQWWLEAGARRGLTSTPSDDPKYIWAVTDEHIVLEAIHNAPGTGEYHGYPLFGPDPFRHIILQHWKKP